MALFLLHRFRNLSRQEVIAMLNFDLAETRAGQDIFQMGVLKKSRDAVIENLEARFEVAPCHSTLAILASALPRTI